MGQTPDRNPGPRYEEALILTDEGHGDPADIGELRRVGDALKAKDGVGVFDLRAGSGLTEAAHKTVRQLVHLMAEGGPAAGWTSSAYRETTPAGNPFPTAVVWWESSAKLKKIVDLSITRDSGKKPTTEVWRAYAADGSTVIETVSDAISYSGVFETNRTRTIS